VIFVERGVFVIGVRSAVALAARVKFFDQGLLNRHAEIRAAREIYGVDASRLMILLPRGEPAKTAVADIEPLNPITDHKFSLHQLDQSDNYPAGLALAYATTVDRHQGRDV
jgi:hypothetical protein